MSAPETYYNELLHYAMKKAPDIAEDVVQDVYLALLSRPYRECGQMRAWLYAALRNRLIDLERKARRAALPRPLLGQSHVSPDPATLALARCEVQDILATAPLTERTRQAVLLCYAAGYSFDGAAPLLGTSRRAVKRLCERGLRTIRTGRPA